jgi:peptide/nickel transport system substrate-binding protein
MTGRRCVVVRVGRFRAGDRLCVRSIVEAVLVALLIAGAGLSGCAPLAEEGRSELIVAIGEDPTGLDASMQTTVSTTRLAMNYQEGLISEDLDGALVPALATEWEALDQTTWQFKLRPDVEFHNGEPFNAEAVKYTLERVLDPENESLWRGQLAGIESVEVVDELTANVVTAAPFPALPVLLARVPMVPPVYAEEAGLGGFASEPVGTGPFQFVEWVKDDRIVLEANPDYWKAPPKLQRVVFKPIPEDSARVAALKAGTVDVALNIPPDDIPSIEELEDLEILSIRSLGSAFVGFDTINPGPMQDRRVRQALNYAVDKETVLNTVLQGQGTLLPGQLLSPSYFGHNPDLTPYPYDLDKARELLAEAGFEDGFEARLMTTSGYYPKDKEVGEALAGQLAAVGVNVTVSSNEFGVYLDNLLQKSIGPMWYQIWRWPPDGHFMLQPYTSDHALSYYANSEFDEHVELGSTTVTGEERLGAYARATEIMREDAPVLFLWQGANIYGKREEVHGLQPLPDERLWLYPVTVGP